MHPNMQYHICSSNSASLSSISLGRPLRRTHTRPSVHSFLGRAGRVAGRHQPTLFSFEISRRREGGQRIVVFFFNTQSPFSSSSLPYISPGPPITGGRGSTTPKEDPPPRIDQKRTFVLNISQRRKKRTSYVCVRPRTLKAQGITSPSPQPQHKGNLLRVWMASHWQC